VIQPPLSPSKQELPMENLPDSLQVFKRSLDQQGFVSPMLTTLAPHEKLKRPSSNQEIFGYLLDGELKLVTEQSHKTYSKHEIFFIDGQDGFEIQCGSDGAQYLFAFKHSQKSIF
jgi:quercetin dioxygenase-like cupin family protein